jgi:hypothetical protein
VLRRNRVDALDRLAIARPGPKFRGHLIDAHRERQRPAATRPRSENHRDSNIPSPPQPRLTQTSPTRQIKAHVPEARNEPATYADLSGHEANTQTGSQFRGRHNPKVGLIFVELELSGHLASSAYG